MSIASRYKSENGSPLVGKDQRRQKSVHTSICSSFVLLHGYFDDPDDGEVAPELDRREIAELSPRIAWNSKYV